MSNKLKLKDYDISSLIQKKPTFIKSDSGKMIANPDKSKWLDYIEWSRVWEILTENYNYVDFWSEKHPDFPDTLVIHLQLGDLDVDREYKMNYPIINGNAVITNPTQMDIHKAELRGFVKAAAKYTGLGLNLWQKDEIETELQTKEKQRAVTIKVVRNIKSMKGLTDLWGTLSENEQIKLKEVFAEQRKTISDGLA